MKKYLYLYLLAGLALKLQAQQQDTAEVLETVQVLSGRASFLGEGVRLSVAENPQWMSTAENLNYIPGIASFEGTAGTAKFSYRGFGARSQYTTSRSLIYLDEIPITSIQGLSSFEEISPWWVESFNLIPNTGRSFPLALGGILQYRTFGNDDNSMPGVSTRLTAGSFGLLQSNARVLWRSEGFGLTAGYERTFKEGWRENNHLQRESLFLNTGWKFKKHRSLRFLGYGIKSRVEIPSSLSHQDFVNNPEKAADSWAEIKGFKKYDRLIAGLTFRQDGKNDKKSSYRLTAFYQYLDNFEPRPFNILEETRHNSGLRGYWETDSFDMGKVTGVLNAFAEYQVGRERNATFQNTYDSLSGTFNHKGQAVNTTILKGRRLNAGATVSSILSPGKKGPGQWILLTGFQVFHQGNRFTGNEGEDFETPWVPAPLSGIYFHDLSGRAAFKGGAKIYRSFSVPSLEENLDPDGSLNAGLKPELAWNIEIESGWQFFKQNLYADLNGYFSQVRNLIVPKVIGPDQVVAANSGHSQHRGLEGKIAFTPVVNRGRTTWKLETQISGSYGSFRYKEFRDTTGSFSGNKLPGFPEWQANLSAELTWLPAHHAKVDYRISTGSLLRAVSGYFVDDANTIDTEPYALLQVWLNLTATVGKHWVIGLQGGVKNVTNEKYASMTVVNNRAFGNASPRFYYPGEPVNWFGGVTFTYNFQDQH